MSASRGCGEVEQIGARARKQEGEREEEEDRRKDRFHNVIKCVLFRVAFLDTSLGYLSSFSPGLSITRPTQPHWIQAHSGPLSLLLLALALLDLLGWAAASGSPECGALTSGEIKFSECSFWGNYRLSMISFPLSRMKLLGALPDNNSTLDKYNLIINLAHLDDILGTERRCHVLRYMYHRFSTSPFTSINQ
jgi:hypothetical protein